jgi:hypothetical protein
MSFSLQIESADHAQMAAAYQLNPALCQSQGRDFTIGGSNFVFGRLRDSQIF